ncbi:MAG: NTP transferase domain-containing protein [Candidatus Schekmanbacteria bacterium]|nr:NTP transferase domain-containing protein [Candidatus Schekmanbacteria bacterium]
MGTNQKIVGVILAAGRGNRMGPLGLNIPKPLLPVGNKPVIHYHVQYLKELGIDEIIVVVGYLKEKIIESLGDGEKFGVKIRYINQEKALGIAHAVLQLEGIISSPFVLILGDIFFIPKNFTDIIKNFIGKRAGGIIATIKEDSPEKIRNNFSVMLGSAGNVIRVIEKPIKVQNNLKGCGIYCFGLSFFDALRRTPRTAMRDEYEITSALQILIDDHYPVYSIDILKWESNLTYPEDILKCNLEWLRYSGIASLVGNGLKIHPDARIVNSVIGDYVVISKPINIVNSIVFSHTEIDDDKDLINTVLADNKVIRCNDVKCC